MTVQDVEPARSPQPPPPDAHALSASAGPMAPGDLDVNEVHDGLVVYDGGRDRVHYLNATASGGALFAGVSSTFDGSIADLSSPGQAVGIAASS